jgi:[acyl-carrier-protein] S-malonyltransferase
MLLQDKAVAGEEPSSRLGLDEELDVPTCAAGAYGMSFALLFPGQGSQSIGMLAKLAALDRVVRATFEEASLVLRYDLWQLIQEGPEALLNATERTQPAMLAAGVATWRLWRRRGGPVPAWVCGHSLGEFTALVCAEVLDFAAAIGLVRLRGQLMQEAVPAGSGSMTAIIGLEDPEVEAACREAASGGAVVEAVNFNAPGQVVIAGERAAVERAAQIARDRGARRAFVLPLSVPAHSSLMREAGERLAQALQGLTLREPRIRYLSAVDACAHDSPEDIRQLLVRQLSAPVRWCDTVAALAASGVGALIECGPGKVLTGLNRRTLGTSNVQALALEDPASLDTALAAV